MTEAAAQTPTASKQDHAAKRLARLAAVQALYQIALTERAVKDVIREFCNHPHSLLEEHLGPGASLDVDRELFGTIVNGVSDRAAALDEMILGAMDAKSSAERLEILLRAILRAGIFELHNCPNVSSGVIINDYVDVAHGFFNAKEPGLVNAVLDRLAKTLRTK